jgi:hypothetical protein
MYIIVVLVLCFIASLTNYLNKNAPLYLKLFPVFLLQVLICEYIGVQMASHQQNNLFFYSITSVVEFMFYFFFFYSVYRSSKAKRTVLILMAVYLVGALVNIFYIQGRKVFHTYSFMVGCLLVIAGSIYYFLQLFRNPQQGSIMREPAFWITSALLFYFGCVLPIYGIVNYISTLSNTLNVVLVFILKFMNILLYSLFTLAFLCKVNFRKYIS